MTGKGVNVYVMYACLEKGGEYPAQMSAFFSQVIQLPGRQSPGGLYYMAGNRSGAIEVTYCDRKLSRCLAK